MATAKLPLGADYTRNKQVARMRRGFDETVKTLTGTGIVDAAADAVLISMGRTLADSLDREVLEDDARPYHISQLSGKLLDVVDRLRGERTAPSESGDALAGFLAGLHEPAAPL